MGKAGARRGEGEDGEEADWLAKGYMFAWGPLWDAWAQELGDSPEALAVHCVANRASKWWGGTLGKLWRYTMRTPGQGKGEVLSAVAWWHSFASDGLPSFALATPRPSGLRMLEGRRH